MLFQFILLQVVVFGVVIFFLRKIFYGNAENAIQRLGHVYQDLLQKQAELQKNNEAVEKELQEKRTEAAAMAEKFKAEAAVETRKKEDEVLKIARAQAEEIIAKAQGSREDMAKEIESQLSKKMLGFASEIVKQAFNERLVQVVHTELVSEFIQRARDMDLSSGGDTAVEFMVRSAVPLKKEEVDKINAMLASKLSRTVKFSEVPDPDLIAGIVMQFGSLMLDGSLVTLLSDSVETVQAKY